MGFPPATIWLIQFKNHSRGHPMCGIAGFVSRYATSSSVIEAMTDELARRGPDGVGYFGVEPSGNQKQWRERDSIRTSLKIALGHRRLSILDLSDRGAQPMGTPDGRYWLIFNGEIYNYVELRGRLKEFEFRSSSDTEVLLYFLVKYGLGFLSELNGIFAFAFYDSRNGELTLVRDPFGIKPLYYSQDEKGIFFASEIRSLLRSTSSKPTIRIPLLSRYLMINWIPDPDTLFEGIHRLEPGHFLKIGPDLNRSKACYWDMRFDPDYEVSESEWIERTHHTLKRAVDRQMRSDVPVGFFLSGGIDSSLLTATAVEQNGIRPKAFTIGFRWSQSKEDNLDLQSARHMKSKFNLDHEEIILEPSILSLLPRVVETLEEPIADPAAICSYLICEAAKSQCKVMISGQGGDEMFGGYPVYLGGQVAYGLQHLPAFMVSMFDVTSEMLPYSIQGIRLQNVHRLRKLLLSIGHPWPEPFILLRGAFRPDQASDLLTAQVLGAQFSPFVRHMDYFSRCREFDVVHQMMYLDIKTYLPCLNLTYTDKTSMAHSIEVRVPFLDMEMALLSSRMPSRYKANINDLKVVLKHVAEKVLPKEVIHRKKTGFGLPIKDWFINDLWGLANDLLSESRLKRKGLFEAPVIQKWLKEHREMQADHSMKLYSLITFELWSDRFLA